MSLLTWRSSKAEVRQRLLDLRSRIIGGESFSALAVLYSEDPGTAPKGGELGYVTRGEVTKPYAEAAWSLKKVLSPKLLSQNSGSISYSSLTARARWSTHGIYS
ncbi:MAG: peptidylprolyl isomerase [Marinilabiliales bacterium]|nr:peptidylprolyl isomerase [Marinilabiliales bacterium]